MKYCKNLRLSTYNLNCFYVSSENENAAFVPERKPGLVIYLTAGDPDLATAREMALAAIDNGADQ